MKDQFKEIIDLQERNLILAMHSSTEIFGVGVLAITHPTESTKSKIFPMGRKLSNNFLNCIDQLIPIKNFKQLARIAVSIGPGGFTGTRVSVTMARTIAQQINCPVDGISSFSLMASRLCKNLSDTKKPFWITHQLPRQGIIGGKYKAIFSNVKQSEKIIVELEKPHLLSSENILGPSLKAENDVEKDILELLQRGLKNHSEGIESPWEEVLPIYPTSPVKIK